MMREFETADSILGGVENRVVSSNSRIVLMLLKKGENDKAKDRLDNVFTNIENIIGPMRSYYLSGYYSVKGEKVNGLREMKNFSKEINYPYWAIRNYEDDPVFDNIREAPEFQTILNEIKDKFWKDHDRIKANLESKGLL